MSDQKKLNGSCLCGAVGVKTTVSTNHIGACHCSMCRKWGGSAFLGVDCGTSDKITFTGEDALTIYKSSEWAERGFCKHCGSNVFYRLAPTDQHHVPVGIFDEADVADMHFSEQIFIEQKPSYYEFANKTKNLTGEEVFAQFGADS